MIFLRKLLLIASALVAFLSADSSAYASPQTRCLPWSKNYIETNADRYDEYVLNTQDYIHTVIRVLNEENLDLSWIWLMLVESGGKLNRTSKAGATGIWQMMKSTAKHYGCDNTDDIECSTRAAAKYIKKLMRDFDNDAWDAVAAYNMGGANFRKYGPNKSVKAYSGIISCLMKNRDIRDDIARLHTEPETETSLIDNKKLAIWLMPTAFLAANDNRETGSFKFFDVFDVNDALWNRALAANDNRETGSFQFFDVNDALWNRALAANDNRETGSFQFFDVNDALWNQALAANDNRETGSFKFFEAKKPTPDAWLGNVHTSHTAPLASSKRQAEKLANVLSYASSFPLFHPNVAPSNSPKRQAKKLANVLSYASSFPLFHPNVAPSNSPKRQAKKLADTLSYASSFALLKSCTAAVRLH